MTETHKGFGLLFEMGCGKTLTAIMIAGTAYQMGKVEKVLVVAPTSVCSVWPKDFAEFADFKANIKVLLGDKNRRLKLLNDLDNFPFKALKVAVVLLEELTEKYPLETVARRLNRTKEAVFLKRQRIGMGGYMANADMLTRNTVSKILGIENRTLQYWERKGLKSYRKRPYVMYRQEDIIKYMREHPEDWNAARVTDDTMFMRYDWYKEKRKTDISHKYNWTQAEVRRMQHLRHEGYSIREIAEMMNRSESSIKYKLYRRSNNGST